MTLLCASIIAFSLGSVDPGSSAPAVTQTSNQQDFDAIYNSLVERQKSASGDMTIKLEEWAPLVIKIMNETDFSKFSSEQLLRLAALNLFDNLPMTDEDEKRLAFVAMVEKLPLRDHWDAALKMRMTMQSREVLKWETCNAIFDMMTSDKALKEFMSGPHRDTFLSLFVWWVPGNLLPTKADAQRRLAAMLPEKWPADWIVMAPTFVEKVFPESLVGPEQHAAIRRSAFQLMDEYLLEHPTGNTADFIKSSKTRLNSAGSLNKLIGNTPKQLTFQWSSDPKIKRLSDLKGRVVVLDFWATWCKPCLQSVPEIKALQKEFNGYPVTILGITSLQGAVFGLESEKIDTEGDPDKEYQLTLKVAAKHAITWPTVFTKEDVFNPEFGNPGIPYGVIIDPAGKVRFEKLHPGNDRAKMRQHIIDLLKEFNLKHPEK